MFKNDYFISELIKQVGNGVGRLYTDFIGDSKRIKIVTENKNELIVEYIDNKLQIKAVEGESDNLKDDKLIHFELQQYKNRIEVIEKYFIMTEKTDIQLNLDPEFDFDFFSSSQYANNEDKQFLFAHVLKYQALHSDRVITKRTLRMLEELELQEAHLLIYLQDYAIFDVLGDPIKTTTGRFREDSPYFLPKMINFDNKINETPIIEIFIQLQAHGFITSILYEKTISSNEPFVFTNASPYKINKKVKKVSVYRFTREGTQLLFALNGGPSTSRERFNADLDSKILNIKINNVPLFTGGFGIKRK